MTYETILLNVEPPFAHITLNRAAVRNAMNFKMVDELLTVFAALRENRDVRAVVIGGAGGHFCAGGDIGDLAQVASMSEAEQDAITARLDAMLRAVNGAPQVVITRLEGAVLGGGFGLACVSDIAITAENASLGLPEVRLGLAPALISPFVIQRVGLTRARQLMLTGERFDGKTAVEYGIAHEAVPSDHLTERVQTLLGELRHCSPNAIREIKVLMGVVSEQSLDENLAYRARLLNALRTSEDGQEGMAAFMQKRLPKWAQPREE